MRLCCTVGLWSSMVGALAAVSPALGQAGTGGTVTAGDCVFRQADAPTASTGTGVTATDFRVAGASGTDQCYQHWWWVRVVGTDTREYCLANGSSPSWTGDTGSITFAGTAYTAVATWKVQPGPVTSNRGQVLAKLRVTNNTGAPLSLAIYSYLDYDILGTAGTDSATQLAANRIQISEGTTIGEFYGPGSSAYQVTTWAALRGLLADAAVTTLANTGLPFGPADWTGAFQYDLNLAASASATVTSVLSINQAATAGCPVDTDGNNLVEPADISLFVNNWFNDLVNGTTIADFDGNGLVQPADVSLFVATWFTAVTSGSC